MLELNSLGFQKRVFCLHSMFFKMQQLFHTLNIPYKTFLTKEDQWKIKPQGHFEHKIGRQFADFEELAKSGLVKFGSGGFFFQQKNPTAKINEGVSFKFKFDDATFLDKIEGVGIVRWVKIVDSPQNSAGLGIEIKSLSDGCREKMCVWLKEQSFKPFIPSS